MPDRAQHADDLRHAIQGTIALPASDYNARHPERRIDVTETLAELWELAAMAAEEPELCLHSE